jgi:hypothetical protein
MEAAAQRDGRRDDGKSNEDAHVYSFYLVLALIGYARLGVHLTVLR